VVEIRSAISPARWLRNRAKRKTFNGGNRLVQESCSRAILIAALSGMAEFLAAVTLLPPPAAHQLPHSQGRDGQPENEQRNQVPAPAAHEAEVVADLASVAVMSEWQLQHGDEPVFWRPVVERVHEWLGVRCCHGQVDRLVVRLGC